MRRLSALVLGSVISAASMGQDLLAGIEPDVLRGLLLTGEQTLVATRDVPDELTSVRMPGQLRWIGSAQRTLASAPGPGVPTVVLAAWRTDAAPAAASQMAIDALAAGGGTVQPAMTIGQGVFKEANASPQPQPQQVCRGDKPFTVNSSAMDGVTYVVVQFQTNATGRCDASMQRSFGAAFSADMPELELPVDPDTGRPARMSGSGGSSGNDQVTARVRFAVRDSAANVASHFARQMTAQGWQPDTAWSGSATAGSSWTRPRESSSPVHAVLQVMATGEGQFSAMLKLGAGQ